MARRWGASTFGAVAALALLLSGGSIVPAAAMQAAPQSALMVAGRICPAGLVGDATETVCDEPLAGVRFDATGGDGGVTSASTNANGIATLRNFVSSPSPRFVQIAVDLPGEFVRSVVRCADAATGTLVVSPQHATAVGITVGAGAIVACVWYVIPEDLRGDDGGRRATVTLHSRICPVGFVGGDYYGDCHDNPPTFPLDFTAQGPQTVVGRTDLSGNVTFDLAPGEYLIQGGVPGEFATLNVYCAPAARPATPFPFTPIGGGVRGPNDLTGIRIVLNRGDAVICDWYNTPEDLRGAVEQPGSV